MVINKSKLNPENAIGEQTALCLENMSCSPYKLWQFPELIRALAAVKKSAAIANNRTGVIGDAACQAICTACDDILEHKHDDLFQVDMLHGGGSIAFNQNMNEVIAALANNYISAGPEVRAKDHVNRSQSTADVCSTAFRLALLDSLCPLLDSIDHAADVLSVKAKTYRGVATLARTCLQDAMPVEISSMFSSWSTALHRRRNHLFIVSDELRQVNIGGTVIGSGEGATEHYRKEVLPALAQLTGYNLTARADLYDAAQNSDDLISLLNSISQLAELLIKICCDLRLLSSGPVGGFGELLLPRVQEGSSFFHNKNNPVVPETMLQVCFHVLGNQRASQAAMERAELNLNVFESGIFFHTMQSTKILTNALQLLTSKCLQGLEVDRARCARLIRLHADKETHRGDK